MYWPTDLKASAMVPLPEKSSIMLRQLCRGWAVLLELALLLEILDFDWDLGLELAELELELEVEVGF